MMLSRSNVQMWPHCVIFRRYLSHFRAIHRGAYFAQLRTTTVRKLLPESWGFLCPVHTPDGSPCGLLNHFTAMCQVVARPPESPEEVQHAIAIVSTETNTPCSGNTASACMRLPVGLCSLQACCYAPCQPRHGSSTSAWSFCMYFLLPITQSVREIGLLTQPT